MLGTINIRTRPLKMACLVDHNDAKQIRSAFRLCSSLWGGIYFPIVLLYNRMPPAWRGGILPPPLARDFVLGHLDAFDPDVLIQFSKMVPDYVTQLGIEIVRAETIWGTTGDLDERSPHLGVGVFDLLRHLFQEHFKYKRKYPVRVVIPKIPKRFSLFWASWFGEFPENLYPLLKSNYFEALDVETIDSLEERFPEIVKQGTIFPLRITQGDLRHVRSSGVRRRDAWVYFCNASVIDDIVGFWNLRATGRRVLPLPKQLKDDPRVRSLLYEFLRLNQRPWSNNPTRSDHAIFVRAPSCSLEEMEEYSRTIGTANLDNESGELHISLQHWYPRIWDAWAREADGVIPDAFYGKEEHAIDVTETRDLRFRFTSLLPSFVDKRGYQTAPRCANEFAFQLYGANQQLAEVFPKSTGEHLLRVISGISLLRREWRVGSNGLVNLVRNSSTETRNIFLAEDIVFAWLKDMGWKPTLSTAGILARQIYKKLNGQVNILRTEKLLGLLEHMNGGFVKKDSSPVEDAQKTDNKETTYQERELPVGELRNRLDGFKENLYESLIDKALFKLGIKVKCRYCFRDFWLSLVNMSDTIVCPKCLESFSAAGNLDSAKWSYKTTGPFSIPRYADGAYAVLLAVDFFGRSIVSSLRITPVLSFVAESSNKKKIEADFALFWQQTVSGESGGGLLFGECKSYGIFAEKDFERMQYVAEYFTGAILAFCTLRKSLTKNEIVQLKRIANTGRRLWKLNLPRNPILILTGKELLTSDPPPYCWDGPIKQQFSRARSLLSLCDATQQIYLGLPSWESEWHDKWEKRRKKMHESPTRTVQPP